MPRHSLLMVGTVWARRVGSSRGEVAVLWPGTWGWFLAPHLERIGVWGQQSGPSGGDKASVQCPWALQLPGPAFHSLELLLSIELAPPLAPLINTVQSQAANPEGVLPFI